MIVKIRVSFYYKLFSSFSQSCKLFSCLLSKVWEGATELCFIFKPIDDLFWSLSLITISFLWDSLYFNNFLSFSVVISLDKTEVYIFYLQSRK